MTNRSRTPHGTAANEFLADGEWHDGRELVLVIERAIAPGVAFRKTEEVRALASARRNGVARERVKELSHSARVNSGKRTMARDLLSAEVRRGTWEVDPWPIPESGYQTGGWRVRSLKPNMIPLYTVAAATGSRTELLHQLLLEEPPLLVRRLGRVTYLNPAAVEQLKERLMKWREGTPERRSAAMKAARAREAAARRLKAHICAHCDRRALREEELDGNLLCHPTAGMDCYELVTSYNHPMPCEHCAKRRTA